MHFAVGGEIQALRILGREKQKLTKLSRRGRMADRMLFERKAQKTDHRIDEALVLIAQALASIDATMQAISVGIEKLAPSDLDQPDTLSAAASRAR